MCKVPVLAAQQVSSIAHRMWELEGNVMVMVSANERRRYIVTSSLFVCAPTQNMLRDLVCFVLF